jgi:hypothetical protein
MWATTVRRARAGRTSGRGYQWRRWICGRGRQWQVRVCRCGRFGRVLVCGRGRYGEHSHAGADVIVNKTMNQKFDFDCGVTFQKGGWEKISYIDSLTSLANYNNPLLNDLYIEL